MNESATKPRSGWAEPCEDGIRRDHKVDCPRTRDRRPRTGRCACPYSWWSPQIAGHPRRRERHYGSLREAQAIKTQQAADAHRQRVAIADAERDARGEVVTVYSHCVDWLRRGRLRWEVSTWNGREGNYRNHLHEPFGAMPLTAVTVEQIEGWMRDRLDAGSGYSAVRSAYYCLTAIFNDAIRRRVTDWNPAEVAELPPEPQRDKRDYLTGDEYGTLVSVCRNSDETGWVRLAGEAALRRAEIAALKVCHVNFDRLEILIEQQVVFVKAHGLKQKLPKSGKPRIVAITPSLAAMLRAHVEAKGISGEDWLFEAERGGAINPAQLSKYVAKIIVRAGFRTDDGTNAFSIHALRRTAATLARQRGVSPEVIRDQLGHSRLDVTTTHYVREHTNPRLAEFAAAMSGVGAEQAG